MKNDRTLQITLVVIGALVVVAAVVVALRPGVSELDPDTPEGVVQSYVQAVIDDDLDQALALVADPPEECDTMPFHSDGTVRVTLESVETQGDESEVSIAITTSGGEPPFDTYEYTESHRFELRLVDGQWRIATAPWPYELCPERSFG